MSNTLTNVNDVLIVAEGLQALKAGLVPLSAFSVDYSPDPAKKGDTINVPVSTARTATTHGGTYISGDTTIASAQVSLSTHNKCSWHLSEAEAYGSSSNLFAQAGKECAYGLSKLAVTTAMALWDTGTFGNTEGTSKLTCAASAFDAEKLADLIGMGAAREWDVQNMRPALFLREAYYVNLLKDPSIIDKSASGADTMASGKVRTTLGVDVYMAPYIPVAQETNLVGFFTAPDSIAIAIRPIEPLAMGAYDFAQVVSDPVSKASMSYRRWVDSNTGILWGTYTHLIGVVVARATGGISILSA